MERIGGFLAPDRDEDPQQHAAIQPARIFEQASAVAVAAPPPDR